ncbi:MAG: helix-turn-helix transcriptional regulator [Symploca sp. SIO1B1]|nr:helix-turn-helix transcriptional regulator [Symploca sp. SIO1A3]NER95358.1 helix-turn-helix transcriptional regulator [Symploca sp. SIO1B1]
MKKQEFMGKSLRELEALTGASYTHWMRYFNGGNSPTLTTLEKYSDALDVPLGELCEWVAERRDATMKRLKRPRQATAQAG